MAERMLLALDLGTTVLAGRLATGAGKLLAEAEAGNPQRAFGDDVIRRLEAARQGHAQQLQRLLSEGINRLVDTLLKQAGRDAADISAAAAAANPAVTHLLAGQPVDKILFPPHRPDFTGGCSLDAKALGLDLPIPLYLFPLLSGYVGGDLLAVLLAAEAPAEPTLYLDLGTNAELALWDGHRWLVTSVAAGPAFEAGHLTCGMRHGPGAVKRVQCAAERLELEVAGGTAPLGICGSGFFSALGAALEGGLIDPRGRIRAADEVATPLCRYLVAEGEGFALQLYRDARRRLLITQQDVRAFQLAKGAVNAGIACLLHRAGLTAAAIGSLRIAGALGTALLPRDLKGVAMVPEIMLDKVRFLPSAVLDGLLVLLAEEGGEERVRQLAAKLKPYPLSGTPAFEQSFLRALDFAG
jgi:uncharacterized 2Fe-2S/4Fe-4S cluster protein (DUF4445 family)